MKTKSFLLALGACTILASCTKQTVDLENNLIDTGTLFSKDRFVEQSAKRNEKDVGYGPQVDTSKDASLREHSRTHISTETPPNYDELQAAKEDDAFAIDLNVENVDIRTFTEMLSQITGVNFLVSDEVNQLITAKIEGVAWTKALDSILKMKMLAKHVEEETKIVRIHDYTTVSQIEDFERKRKENMQKSIQLKQAAEPMNTEVFKLYYTNPEEVKEMLSGVLDIKTDAGENASGLRDTRPEITMDNRKNLLIVKARSDDMTVISKLIKEVDSRTQQVFIEAFIVEVTDGFEQALGTRLAGRITNVDGAVSGTAGEVGNNTLGANGSSGVELPVSGAFGGIGFIAGLGSVGDLRLELSAMEAKGLTKVISNPKVFTLDNKEAIIFQGDEVPYETVSDQGTNIEFKQAGLKLAVKPTVVGDGNLLMDITVNKDTVDTSQPNPPIRKSEIQTSLVSKNGAIVVIGGIYDELQTQSSDKIPGLGDIPAAGKLFRRDAGEDNRRELMVFIAPRVI